MLCWGLGAAASPKIAGKFQPVPEIFKEIRIQTGKRCEGVADAALIKSGATNCILGDTNAAPTFFILGDSHARMWTTGLDVLAKKYKMQGIALTYAGCTPIIGFSSPLNSKNCPETTNASIDYIIESPVKNVVLSGRWFLPQKRIHGKHSISSQEFYIRLTPILEKLNSAGKKIYFLYDVPELSHYNLILEKLLEARHSSEKNIYMTIPVTERLKQQQFAKGIELLQKKYHFITLDPTQTMLDKAGNMLIIDQSHPIYRDDNHLTDYGSIHFREVFLPLIQDILAKQQTAAPENTQPVTLQ